MKRPLKEPLKGIPNYFNLGSGEMVLMRAFEKVEVLIEMLHVDS